MKCKTEGMSIAHDEHQAEKQRRGVVNNSKRVRKVEKATNVTIITHFVSTTGQSMAPTKGKGYQGAKVRARTAGNDHRRTHHQGKIQGRSQAEE